MARMLMIAMLAGVGFAQTTNPPEGNSQTARGIVPSAAKDSTASAAIVAPGDTVLTIHGICSLSQRPSPADTEDCTVTMKRQQFEDLLGIVVPGQGAAAAKHSLAKTYTDLLAFESAAKRSGIDTSPQFLEAMEWLRLRTLADLYRRTLERESSSVSEEEIDQYYREHISQFEEAKLRRIVFPRNNFAVTDKQEFEKKAFVQEDKS